jgi:phosphatidylglycerophosphatase C
MPSQESGTPGRPLPDRQPLAVFDFDGTITKPDTFRIFLRQVRSRRAIAGAFLRHGPSIAMALRGGRHRDRAKERVCFDLLGGLSEEEVGTAAKRTVRMILDWALREDSVSRLLWHLTAGHRVIVVSASFEAYVKPVMASLGVTEVIATRWEVGPTGVLTGKFDGVNVRGAAKATLLVAYLGGPSTVDVAYGNTKGDAALLAMAEHPVWIRRWRSLGPPPCPQGG